MISDVPTRKNDVADVEGAADDDDEYEKMENISDEGIDEGASDRETPPQDYLISTVSKADLELMSTSSSLFR